MSDADDSGAAQALLMQAVGHHQQGRLVEAQTLYRDVLARAPAHADALHLSGVVAAQMGRPDEAVALIDQALVLTPTNAGAHYNRGNALRDLKRFDAALHSYDEAIRHAPTYAEAYYSRGSVLKDLKQPEAAAESYRRAVTLRPDYAEAHNSLGTVLQGLGRYEEALAAFDQAVRLNPGAADVHNNRGVTLAALTRHAEAVQAFDAALRLKPELAAAHFNRAGSLIKVKRDAEALDGYDAAFRLDPEMDGLRGERLYVKMRNGFWADVDKDIADLVEGIRAGKPVSQPLHVHAVSDAPDILRRVAAVWTNAKVPPETTAPVPRRARDGKIRIGYFSPDFHSHALSILMAGVFEAHDRARFETYAFAYGGAHDDPMRQRLTGAFDRFLDIGNVTDGDTAAMARGLGIDIAVDLAGHTAGGRTGIFAKRAAPLQVNYLGYPGTMGAPYIDYVIADATVVPGRAAYDEKVVVLPESFQPNDRQRPHPDKVFTRTALGLPENAFVFCSFNTSSKITPAAFDGWMRILGAVDGSVLWVFEDTPLVAGNLRREAAARGISGDRVVFAARMAPLDHLARHAAADLFLDTQPYNAGTTASDSLWMGLPVLTRMGQSYVSRMGASLLQAVGLPELITATQADYEALAIALAREPARLTSLKAKLVRNRLTMPLFDTVRTTRHLEDAFTQMMARYDAGLAPEHFDVAPRA